MPDKIEPLDVGRPSIRVPGLPVLITRGYEVSKKTGNIEFLGRFDGPLLRVTGPHSSMIFRVSALDALIEALQIGAAPPVAEEGAHDADIENMNYKRVDL